MIFGRTAAVIILMCILQLESKGLDGSGNQSGFEKGFVKFSYNYFPSFAEKISGDIESFGLEKNDPFMFLWGGEICGNINQTLGIGIQYFTGESLTDGIVTVFDGDINEDVRLDRSVKCGMSFTSLIINYRKSLPASFGFFGTVSAGYGSVRIILSQDAGDQYYEDLLNSMDINSDIYKYNRSVIYEPSLYIFKAENGLRFQAGRRISVDLTAGYTYAFVSDRGEINYGFESLKNVPSLDFKGMIYGLGISFGY